MYNCVVVDCAYDVVLQFRQQILTPLPPTLLGYACDHCVELTSDSLRHGFRETNQSAYESITNR